MKKLAIFWFINSLFAAAISLNYFLRLGTEFSAAGTIYFIFTALGHFFIFALLGWILLAAVPELVFKRINFKNAKFSHFGNDIFPKILSAFFAFAGTLILLSDTFVYGIYRYHIYNKFVLDLLFSKDAGGIFIFTFAQYFLMFFLISALLGIQIFFLWISKKIAPKTSKKINAIFIAILVFSLGISHLFSAYFSATANRAGTEISAAFPAYFPLTANRFLIKHGFVDPEKLRQKVRFQAGKTLNFPKNPLVPERVPEKNILVIFCDSWNFRAFSPEAMPNLAKFAENSQVFEKHFSGDHGTRTGVPSFFHGLPGLYFYAIRDGGVSAPFIDVLAKEKYDFGIFACAGLSNPPFDRTIFANVPAPLHDNFSAKAGGVPEGDEALTSAWISWLENWQNSAVPAGENSAVPAGENSTSANENSAVPAERKFFGFLFYDLFHAISLPKNSPKKFQPTWENARYENLGKNTDPTPFWNLYLNDAVFLDEQIGRVLDDLRSRGLLKNTIVIITGDHGQEFNENKKNLWLHGSAFSEPQLHVPLIIFDADLPPKKFSHWTAHYDVPATIFQNYLHVKNPPSDYTIGKNLFDETPRNWLLVGHPEQFAVLENDKITHVKFDKTYEIFDWTYSPLPNEKLNAQIFQKALEQAQEFYKK